MGKEKRDTERYAFEHDIATQRAYLNNPKTRGNKEKKAAVAAFIAAACIAATAAISKM